MLEKIVIGWEEIEPVFLTNIALRKPFILLGRHGTSKTTCAKEISKMYEKDEFRFYDATKDDLISIAGIPIPERLAQGKLEFSEHDRSIWGAKVILVDELSRANKESQNLWLEILEEKTCFGKALHYEALIATMNPESYASCFKLDEALLDRFYAAVPVPDLQKGTDAHTFKKILKVNLRKRDKGLDKQIIRKEIEEIRKSFKEIKGKESTVEGIVEYASNFMEILLSEVSTYISPRKSIQLTEEILALSSYYKMRDETDYLEKGARDALLYTLGIPLKIKPELLMQVHENLKPILRKHSLSEVDRIRIEIAKIKDTEKMLFYLKKNIKRIKGHLPLDEIEKLLGKVNEKIGKNGQLLLLFKEILGEIEGHEEQKREIEGKLLIYLTRKTERVVSVLTARSLYNEEDLLSLDKARQFTSHLRSIPLPFKIAHFLFSQEVDEEESIIEFIKKGEFDAK